MNRPIAVAVVACALGLTPACDQKKKTTTTAPTTSELIEAEMPAAPARAPSRAEHAEADKQLADADITDVVRRELSFSGLIDADAVSVETIDGIVALSGAVDNSLAKRRATEIAQTVKGVRSVSNTIRVQAKDRSAAELRKAVADALVRDPAADRYEVRVTANDGTVTLRGKVSSWHEKQLAERLALRVSGVEDVVNEIEVSYDAQRTDPDILADVRSALEWDALVDGHTIQASVDDGAVTLTGAVGSVAERMRAISDAWVLGVKSVDASGLDIQWWADDEHRRHHSFVLKPDTEIASAVEKAALVDPRVLSTEITPSVRNGVVTLHGTVDNLRAKQVAERLARNTTGVVHVRNLLNVRPRQPIGDQALAQSIRLGLHANPITESYEVEVQVNNGIVTLDGEVDTFAEKAEAEDIALGTRGVVGVINQIVVEVPGYALTYDDLIDGPDVLDWMLYVPTTTEATDEEIEASIRSELLWDPDVDLWQVAVEVDDGTAILTGMVDSYFERREAAANAYEGGATAVINQLIVTRAI